MRVLALDTSTRRTSAALIEDGSERASWRGDTSEDLCQHLALQLGALLARAGAAFSQLDLIAVGLGPGSFTSLRIGLATAKAIAIAHNVDLVGVSSLAALAWQMAAEQRGLLCAALDARRGDLYAAIFRAADGEFEQIATEFVAKPDALGAKLAELGEAATVFGDLPAAAAAQLKESGGTTVIVLPAPILPDAVAVAELARRRLIAHGPDDVAALRPIYVRKSYAEEASNLDLGLR